MKIFYCINGLYNSGGMERILTEKVNYLSDNYNYEIIIITTEGKRKDNYFKVNEGIKIINLDIGYYEIDLNKNELLKKIILKRKERTHLLKLKKVMKEYNPDIIISLGDRSRNVCKKVKGIKILENHFEKETFLGVTKEKGKLYFFNIYKKIKNINLINKYNKFVVLTEEDKEQWLKLKKIKNIEVIPNPLPFYPDKISNCENKTIISVGRLEYQKGYDELIEIWNKLFKKYPDWKLEIYGEGSLKKELQEKITKLEMTNCLFLKGTDKNIKERYLKSSIYIMTSRYEGFGMVLVEAMACGLPVISFDCPCGPKDIIKDGEDGFLIKSRNLDEMVNKLEILIQNEEQRKNMGKQAHENIIRYSKDKVMLQWKNLFEKFVKNKES